MDCHEVMDFMQRDLDHDLNQEELDQMKRHLEECPDCSLMYERLTRLSEQLTQMPKVDPPISIVDSILPQLNVSDTIQQPAAEPPAKPQAIWLQKLKDSISLRALGGVAAAAVLLTLIVGGMLPSKDDASDSALDQVMVRSSGSDESAADAGTDNEASLFMAESSSTDILKKSSKDGEPLPSEQESNPSSDLKENSGNQHRAGELESSSNERGMPQQEKAEELQQAEPSSEAPSPVTDGPSTSDAGILGNTPDTTDAYSAGADESGEVENQPSIAVPGEGYGIAAVPIAPAAVPSPDGRYEAVILYGEQGPFVHIMDANGTTLMETSEYQEGELKLAWKSEAVLSVTVVTPDQSMVYEINVESKEEKLVSSP